MSNDDEEYMAIALEQAGLALLAGEAPVGASLVRDGEVLAAANGVIAELDPTAHAELRVIREAARRWRQLDLAGARLYVTVEPCAMCRAACHYAGITQIVFGARLQDLHALTGNELGRPVSNDQGAVSITGDCCRDQCLDLLQAWAARRAN